MCRCLCRNPAVHPPGQGIQGLPLRFHPSVRVTCLHSRRDVSGDAHDRLVAGLRLREFGNCLVTQIVEPESRYRCSFSYLTPGRATTLHWLRRVNALVLTSRKEKVLWLSAVERLCPLPEFTDGRNRCIVNRNCSFARFSLALANRKHASQQVNVPPAQILYLATPH